MHAQLLRAGLLVAALAPVTVVSAPQSDAPDWLGGPPDVSLHPERCALYDWLLAEADEQTDGKASRGDLSRRRVINLANKLADHHRSAGSDVYGATVRYLVFDAPVPSHFSFRIDAPALDRLLDESAGDDVACR